MSETASAYAQAVALFRAGDLAGAERALTPVDARSFEAVHLLAGIKRARGEESEALALFDVAVALKPESAAAQSNRAGLLLAQGQFAQAADAYKAALALRPDHAEAWYNRARALAMVDRTAEAVESYAEAAQRAPNNPDIAADHAAALQASGHLHEARTQFERALLLAPDHTAALQGLAALHYNEGVALLRAGDYESGFALYEDRRAAGAVEDADLSRGKPPWRGEELDGPLHIWSEMGVGEAMLFASLLPRAAERAACIQLECDPRLLPLFARSFPFAVCIPVGGNIDAAAQCSIASLAHILNITRADLNGVPYIKPDAGRAAGLRTRYEDLANGKPIIGIAWRSKNTLFGDKKSSRLEDWGALLREPYFFVNLQYGDVSAEIENACAAFGCTILDDPEIDQMRDLDGFAAQIAALDHVVSVSNTTVHMAGALGKRAIVLVPPERRVLWYWGDVGETTPWYKSLHLLAHETDWPDRVARAAALLRESVAS